MWSVRRPDINLSAAASTLEPCPSSAGGAAVRMGISYVRGVGDAMAERIAAGRPYVDMEDLVRRTGVSVAQAEALATAGAFEGFGLCRRAALWSAGAAAAAGAGERGACEEGPGLRSGLPGRGPRPGPAGTAGPARRGLAGPARRDPEGPR